MSNTETFKKSIEALRKYILANPDKVRKDLDEMRKKSTGQDIYQYLKNLGN